LSEVAVFIVISIECGIILAIITTVCSWAVKCSKRQGFTIVNNQRPVNLNLLTIRQPVTAVVSILHRISGLILFLSLPVILWALGLALADVEGYNTVANYLAMPFGKIIALAIWAAVAIHLCAGFRHIIMDMGWAESLHQARLGAFLVLLLTLALVILGGIWLW
jgi:succinate dehydrogenase / fumarate reductase, cytochrome b subunit